MPKRRVRQSLGNGVHSRLRTAAPGSRRGRSTVTGGRMSLFPCIFNFVQDVVCDGVRARVSGTGRVLLIPADGKWWCSGVVPGGMIESGRTPQEAYAAFRQALREAIEELASEARSL